MLILILAIGMNTNQEAIEQTILDERYLSLGIACLWAWLVLHVAIAIANYRYNLFQSKSSFWKESRAKGLDIITNAAVVMVFVAGMLWVASAVGVAWKTHGLDWRMQSMVFGLSRRECLYSMNGVG